MKRRGTRKQQEQALELQRDRAAAFAARFSAVRKANFRKSEERAQQRPATKPCLGCPWISQNPEVQALITPTMRQAAESGAWFCCHERMGDCIGARAQAKIHSKEQGE